MPLEGQDVYMLKETENKNTSEKKMFYVFK